MCATKGSIGKLQEDRHVTLIERSTSVGTQQPLSQGPAGGGDKVTSPNLRLLKSCE